MKKIRFDFSLAFFLVLILWSSNNFIYADNEKYIYPVRKGEWALSLNGTWKFKYIPSLKTESDSMFYREDFNVSQWDSILVPGDWDMQGFGENTYQEVNEGTGLYRTQFKVPAGWNGRQTYILFDGILYASKFYVNGKYIGSWANGYSPVMFDISKYLNENKENILAVEVASKAKGTDFDIHDAWCFYGIFRNVNLFSLPQIHLKDYTFITTLDESKNAHISISAVVESANSFKNISLAGELISRDGNVKKNFTINLKKKESEIFGSTNFIIENPDLWTAETPNLYMLTLKLLNSGKEEQTITEKVGLKQVTIKDAQLLLNGTAIKLRGIDIHQTSPDLGNAFNDEYLLRDFNLLKKANINFARISHYPPHPRFVEMCDSIGFYVMEEVPFGGGRAHLTDSSYQNILLSRAYSTLNRDKNHPSIIVWSVGNENPVTELTCKTAKCVKSLDPTRPICFPETGQYFRENNQNIPEYVDIYAPHYTTPSELQDYINRLNRPIIVTEYAHSLGLDFDMMQNVWELMYKNKITAGGGVWDFTDLGILKKSKTPVNKNAFTPNVWLDRFNYYEARSTKGSDGITYANRVPQPDYFEVQNVYAPVRVNIDSAKIKPGKQTLDILIENRYDFTNLSEVKCFYGLYHNNDLIEEHNLDLNVAPHSTKNIELSVNLPEKFSNDFYFLKFNFYDKEGLHLKEEVVRLLPENSFVDWIKNIHAERNKFTKDDSKEKLVIKNSKTIFEFDKNKGSISFSRLEKNISLIKEGLFLRTGRKQTLASWSYLGRRPEYANYFWSPILKNPEVLKKNYSYSKDSAKITEGLKFKRDDKEGQFVEGAISYTLNSSGWINVEYNFKPLNGTGIFLEAGVSFVIPKELSQMRWVGDGPYPSYPDKDMLDEFGIFQKANEDLYFQGNRRRVDAALFTNKVGNGLLVISNGDDVAVENVPDGIMISHNAQVSSRFNKYVKPLHEVSAADEKGFHGKFSIRAIEEKDWNGFLENVFGNPLKNVEPYKPFYHSYDQ